MKKNNLQITLFALDAGQTEILNYATKETGAQNRIERIFFSQAT